jgi:hypothetical protein
MTSEYEYTKVITAIMDEKVDKDAAQLVGRIKSEITAGWNVFVPYPEAYDLPKGKWRLSLTADGYISWQCVIPQRK